MDNMGFHDQCFGVLYPMIRVNFYNGFSVRVAWEHGRPTQNLSVTFEGEAGSSSLRNLIEGSASESLREVLLHGGWDLYGVSAETAAEVLYLVSMA